MLDIIFAILFFLLCILCFNKLSKIELEMHDKRLKNEIEKTKLIIEEFKK